MQRQTSGRIGAFLAAVQVWGLGMVFALFWGSAAVAFDSACGAMSSTETAGFPSIVQVWATGRAIGTYRDRSTPNAAWKLGNGEFTLRGRGFVVGQLVVTAAHVVYPSQVELRLHQHASTIAPVVTVEQTTIRIGGSQSTDGILAEIVHLNHRVDLAILRPRVTESLPTFPYHLSATWWREVAGEASSLLRTGNCVVALTAKRDANQAALPGTTMRTAHVAAPYPMSFEPSVVAGLNPNAATIATPLLPGDSGSPVVAFDDGQPLLVGVVIATRHPFESVSYISRLDPLLPMLEALQVPQAFGTSIAHAGL